MKFNWGHGIVLVIVLGVSFFLTLMYITTRERIDMVTEEYYPKELKYEEQITKEKNYKALEEGVSVEVGSSIIVQFPKLCEAPEIKGMIHFYRPSDKRLDIDEELGLDNQYQMSFAKELFKTGKYQLIIEWSCGEEEYLTKQDLYIE